MKYEHTNRHGFWLGFVDFFTAGLFFLFYMHHGLQDEIESVLGHKVMAYWKAYLLGPMIATYRFFRTLNLIETELNRSETSGEAWK